MKQQLLVLGLLFSLVSCSTSRPTLSLDEVFTKHFDHKMISSGPNFPDFHTTKDSIDLFLVALHEGISKNDFRKKAGWSARKMEEQTSLLISKNWLKQYRELKPTVFVCANTQGKSLFNYATPIAIAIKKSIGEFLTNVKSQYQTTALSKTHSFETLSFLILSNVLLDNWQINNVEREFLKASKRPKRHGKHYYYAIMENVNYPKEDFGIYGNGYSKFNDSLTVGMYGNNRNKVYSDLKKEAYRREILKDAPRVSKEDNAIFNQMAASYKPKLISVLDNYIDYCINVYEDSGYANEIAFEEFFIWWYHFIYTLATNMMADSGMIKLPDTGNTIYLIEK